jgi:hypothetical protein
MSSTFGNGGEMREHERWLTAQEAERLLDGVVPAERPDLVPVAERLTALAQTFEASSPPLDVRALAAAAASETRLFLSEKGDPAATSASKANRPARQVSGLPKRRIPVLSAIATFLATTAGKVTVAAALTSAAATGGLAATDNLPVLQDGNGPAAESVIDEPAPVNADLDEADDDGTPSEDAEAAEGVEPCADVEGEAKEACEAELHEADEADDLDDADEVEVDDDDADEADDHDDDADEADDHDDADEADEADEVDDVDEADDHDDADEVEVEVQDVEGSDGEDAPDND